ncbi:MAG: hypothetical protein JHC95_17045 [Solirubrobacteraceae bacterium]|nr:hypothetical protein [Solirubrobacteraceae bacterium]
MRAALVAVLAVVAIPASASAAAPTLGGCPVLPSSNAINRDISRAPVDQRSKAYIASILGSGNRFLHADFGGDGEYGIPFSVVDPAQPLVPITFTAYGDESDPGPYPIPSDAPVENGGDRHVLVVQREKCKLYELYAAERNARGWNADSGAVYDLRSNKQRPAGWTSADAAGLPILPLLARYDEVAAGEIRHALRFTVSRSQAGYVAPARHLASSDRSPKLPPMGLRLRLKRSYKISGYTGQSRVVLNALRRYGMIVADNGSDWFISGASDRRWDDEDLNQLKRVPGSAFEVVRHGRIRR